MKLFLELPIKLPAFNKNELHAMHLYVIEFERRDELLCYLRKNGVGASLHYPLAVHQHAAYQGRIRRTRRSSCNGTILQKAPYLTFVS